MIQIVMVLLKTSHCEFTIRSLSIKIKPEKWTDFAKSLLNSTQIIPNVRLMKLQDPELSGLLWKLLPGKM